ncbi:transposase [Lentibacillus amyloliquefaciens]|uniref:transposase n=1 Tax=Lentibacillus amyloliquefaciens TaxID=1472767 RepID=UPI000B2B8447|nr:IS5/IS1182 family transposase [Lentibacillus sp. CBA3610]
MHSPKQNHVQPSMFQYIDMEDLVPEHHILRRVKDVIDFSAVHDWVKPLYSEKTGRPSTNAELVVRLIVLEYLFNHSERELFETFPMHAGYLWFCGLDFESSLPDRTTLVKTRALWRRHGIFDDTMMQVVNQCIASGLVRPDVHAGVDGTQVRANASIHSLEEIELAPVQTIEDQSDQLQENTSHEDFHGKTFSNQTHRSTTDPDARLYKKSKGQEAHPRYLVHNLAAVRFQHPQTHIQTLSGDKTYGTPAYLAYLISQGIIPLVSLRNHELEEIPTWQRKTHNPEQQRKRQEKADEVRTKNQAKQVQIDGKYQDIQNKRVQCEHGFAEAKTVHGLDRANSRGLDCMQEQALCTAIVQNLKKLSRFKGKRPRTGVSACAETKNRDERNHDNHFISFIFKRIREKFGSLYASLVDEKL